MENFFITAKREEAELNCELVFFLSRAFLLICRSEVQAIAHDAAHHVFMALPPHTSTRGGEAPPLRRGPKPCQGEPWREEMPSE